MAGNIEGGKKAADTNRSKYGADFYAKIGRKGGRKGRTGGFVSSPMIHVNGQDIFYTVTESDCGCCGEIAGVQVDCRTYEHDGKTYEVPTKEMLADAILKKVFRPTGLTNVKLLKYELPDNLKRFFEGKERKAAASCCCSGSGDCC